MKNILNWKFFVIILLKKCDAKYIFSFFRKRQKKWLREILWPESRYGCGYLGYIIDRSFFWVMQLPVNRVCSHALLRESLILVLIVQLEQRLIPSIIFERVVMDLECWQETIAVFVWIFGILLVRYVKDLHYSHP